MSLWISGSAQRSTFHVGLVASSFEPHFVVEVAVLSRKSRPKPAREDARPYSYKSLITHHLPWLRLRRGNPGEFMAYGRGLGVGRTRGVGVALGVEVGVGLAVGLPVAVGVAVGTG